MTSSVKIKKSPIPVVIYTTTHRIAGMYHALDNGGRLLDDLNEQGRHFMPLTDARVSKSQGDGDVVVSKFLAVNLRSITLFFQNPKVVPRESTESRSRPGGQAPAAKADYAASETVPDLVIGTIKPARPFKLE